MELVASVVDIPMSVMSARSISTCCSTLVDRAGYPYRQVVVGGGALTLGDELVLIQIYKRGVGEGAASVYAKPYVRCHVIDLSKRF